MRRKGCDFKLAPHLTWRYCQERDLKQQARGLREWKEDGSSAAYAVIVPVKRCLSKKGNFKQKRLMDAECLPFDGWSRTNMVYGAGWRKQTRGRRFWVRLSELSKKEQKQWREHDKLYGEQIYWDDEDKKDGQVAKWFDVYWTCTTYWVEDNRVYTTTGRTFKDPNPTNRRACASPKETAGQ